MLGQKRDIIYDLDGSLSPYFFNSSSTSGTIVANYNHIANFNQDCLPPLINQSAWNSVIMCGPRVTIRRILFTNIISVGAYYYQFYWASINILPITNISEIRNSTNMNYSLVTTAAISFPSI
jgi:hypothetical protein